MYCLSTGKTETGTLSVTFLNQQLKVSLALFTQVAKKNIYLLKHLRSCV